MAGKETVVIGVLALQGDFAKHSEMIERCGAKAVPVRFAENLDTIDGLIIPGGESTTVGKLLARYGIGERIIHLAHKGMPIFGTCTGMILLADKIIGSDQDRLGLMNMTVLRNAFGRQVESFEADLIVDEIGPPAVRAVFIRAPYAVSINGKARVLSRCDNKIVFVRQENLLACAFHPELTDDTRIHKYFIHLAEEWRVTRTEHHSEKQ